MPSLRSEARGPWLADHPPLTWGSRAACRGQGTDAFFGTSLKSSPDEAPAICNGCPVRAECLEHGLRYEADGTWGGVPQRELRVMRKNMGIRIPVYF